MFLFALKGGGKKISYGKDADDAYEILALRLDAKELEEVRRGDFVRIRPQEMHKYAHELR
jgi:hypothetical protein